jgi:hypothetical protein
MMLQNTFVPASTFNRAISLIAVGFGDYRKVQPGTIHRKTTRASIANQSGMIEPQSNP